MHIKKLKKANQPKKLIHTYEKLKAAATWLEGGLVHSGWLVGFVWWSFGVGFFFG